jgi:hypothetical protein
MVGTARSMQGVRISEQATSLQQALHAAEAGMDELLVLMENNPSLQQAVFQSLGTWPVQLPNEAAALSLPANSNTLRVLMPGISYTWCQPTLAAAPPSYPVCIEGRAASAAYRSEAVVSLPAVPGSGRGVMVHSQVFLGPRVEVEGNIVVLGRSGYGSGDTYGSVQFYGEEAGIGPSADGAGGRVLLYDVPDEFLSLAPWEPADPSAGGDMPPILDDATLLPTGKAMLLGEQSAAWTPPITVDIPDGSALKPLEDQIQNEIAAYNGVTQSTYDAYVRSIMTADSTLTDPAGSLERYLVEDVGLSEEALEEYYTDVARDVRLRTKPNPSAGQVPPITVDGYVVNQGDWRIVQDLGAPAKYKFVQEGTAVEVVPDSADAILPGGTWLLQGASLPADSLLTFDGQSRVYLIGDNGNGNTLDLGVGSEIRAMPPGNTEPLYDGVQIVVPCRPRAATCMVFDEDGVCLDEGPGNPDLEACADPTTNTLYLDDNSQLYGSVHAPFSWVDIHNGAHIEGDELIADVLSLASDTIVRVSPGPDLGGGVSGNTGLTVRVWRRR